MFDFIIKKGSTSQILPISIYDSSKTDGSGLTGLVYNTSSLTAYYNRVGASGNATAITLASATKGTYTSGGFVAIDGTNMPGQYELHIPDAALASGADRLVVQLKGAANMVPATIKIKLVDNEEVDSYSILSNGTYGLSAVKTLIDALPTAASIATAVWAAGTRTLSSFGSLVSDIATAVWGATTRTLSAFGFSVTASSVTDKTGYSLIATPPTVSDITTAIMDKVYGDGTLKLSDLLVIISGIFGGRMTSTLDATQSGTVTFYNRANEAVVTATFVNGGRTAVTWNKVV